jgi:hypothetical protein
MKEVLGPTLVADEPETFVDEEACDSPGRHTRSPPFTPRGISQGRFSRPRAPLRSNEPSTPRSS